jgi:hypothetical protein
LPEQPAGFIHLAFCLHELGETARARDILREAPANSTCRVSMRAARMTRRRRSASSAARRRKVSSVGVSAPESSSAKSLDLIRGRGGGGEVGRRGGRVAGGGEVGRMERGSGRACHAQPQPPQPPQPEHLAAPVSLHPSRPRPRPRPPASAPSPAPPQTGKGRPRCRRSSPVVVLVARGGVYDDKVHPRQQRREGEVERPPVAAALRGGACELRGARHG